ncbi:MAG: glycosyltransferase family A protein [Ignavibacteriota bacterium]|nr:glycosyltransferase family A protein [Ignavibacteriota bacterium]
MQINLKKPEISIIITVYNRKRTFYRALDSILNQSYRNFEIIVVDDGSTDNFHNKLLSYIKYDYRIKFITHSNRKTPLSLNTGIILADGKYITFLDSDDEYEINHLTERIKYFKKYRNADLIHSPANIIGKEKDMFVPDARNTKKLIHLKDCVLGATLFGKREVFFKLKGFKNKYSYDSDFVKRAEKVFTVSRLESKTYIYYRNSKDSILTNLKMTIHEKH